MRITAIQAQVKNPDRVNIFVDDQFLLAAQSWLVYKLALRINQELTPSQLQNLQDEADFMQNVERVINFLSIRPRSTLEIRTYLRRKKIEPTLIDRILQHLTEQNLIDDRAFSEFWVESRDRFRPRGSNLLRQELRQKGVEREVLEDLIDEEQDEQRALDAGLRKAQSLLRLPDMEFSTFRDRLGAFLLRRGFRYSVASNAVKQLWESEYENQADA